MKVHIVNVFQLINIMKLFNSKKPCPIFVPADAVIRKRQVLLVLIGFKGYVDGVYKFLLNINLV